MLYAVKRYQDEFGKVPYSSWIQSLQKRDPQAAAKVSIRIMRAEAGNFGDHKYEREGVWALRINYGPGYRLYYAAEDRKIILLLAGGDKTTQRADLKKAVQYLKNYHQRLKL